jgi:hypothetical protein
MAFGTGRGNSNLKAFAFRIVTQKNKVDLDKPHFDVYIKEDDKWVVKPDLQSDRVSGNLIGVEPKATAWGNKTIRSVNVTLQDKDEIYFVTVPYSLLGRNVMNSLLALTSFENVTLGLYQSKPKTQGAKTYASASVRQNDVLIKGKFSKEEQPEVPVIELNGAPTRNFNDLDRFYDKHLVELNAEIKKRGVVAPVAAVVEETAANAAPTVDESTQAETPAKDANVKVVDDDVPF